MVKRRNCSLGAIIPLFHNIMLPFSDLHIKTGTRFSLRDKRLFEISEVKITRVCQGRQLFQLSACFPVNQSQPEKWPTLIGRNFLPVGTPTFSFGVNSFSVGLKNGFNRVFSLQSASLNSNVCTTTSNTLTNFKSLHVIRVNSFSAGSKNNFNRVFSLQNVSVFP